MRMRGNYTLLDANVMVALLDRKDSLHKKAVEEIGRIEGKTTFAVISPILTETYSVLARRCLERRGDCDRVISALQELESRVVVFHPSFDEYHTRTVLFLKQNPALNYNDWLLYIFSKDNLCDVLTFDKRLRDVITKQNSEGL